MGVVDRRKMTRGRERSMLKVPELWGTRLRSRVH